MNPRGLSAAPPARLPVGRPAGVCAALLVASCGCYVYVPTAACTGRIDAPPRPVHGPEQFYGGFGYIALGYTAYADFFGNVTGLEPGTGLTVTVPPLVPASFVLAAGAVAWDAMMLCAAAEGGGGDVPLIDPAAVLAGCAEAGGFLAGVADPSRHIISEFSMDLSYSWSTHRDRTAGGELTYQALLLGVRLGGPRQYVPRYYICGGYGYFVFDYEAAPPARYDAYVGGPYWGAGLELFPGPNASLGIEFKMHFYFGDDESGTPVDGGYRQLALLMTMYW